MKYVHPKVLLPRDWSKLFQKCANEKEFMTTTLNFSEKFKFLNFWYVFERFVAFVTSFNDPLVSLQVSIETVFMIGCKVTTATFERF